jgi:flagellar biogenesis protein FliO
MAIVSLLTFINLIIILGLVGIGIYGFVLFVKLANRGIRALDIYISEKTK